MSDGCGNAFITSQRHRRRMAWSDVEMSSKGCVSTLALADFITNRMGSITLGEEYSIVASIASTDEKTTTNPKC